MKKEKAVTVTITENGYSINVKNLSPLELLGVASYLKLSAEFDAKKEIRNPKP